MITYFLRVFLFVFNSTIHFVLIYFTCNQRNQIVEKCFVEAVSTYLNEVGKVSLRSMNSYILAND